MARAHAQSSGATDAPCANRALLIESDAPVARSLQTILGAAGFAVHWTAQAQGGVAAAASGEYDLVILGPHPPTLTGGDLKSSLRLGRIDVPFRLLSVSAAADGGAAMQINPCP